MRWNPRIEEMPVDELRKLQYKLMKTLVYRLYSFSPFYHDRMKDAGVHPDDIRSLADVKKLPFMYKKDLRDNYPNKMFTASTDELVRYHVSSGTTGKPTVVGYTQKDLDTWTESLARSLTACGIGRGDVMQVSYGYGLFTGGLGLHYGAEKVGATVVPASVGSTEKQITLIQDLNVTAIACTPSYLNHISDVAEKMGVSIKNDTSLRVAVLGAEPWTSGMRDKIQERLGIRAHNIFGTSEISGPMFTDCVEQKGIHIWGDIAYTEVIDSETGENLPNGESGELVVTVLQKEAMPMIRYRVGDITSLDESVCPCGCTHPRISRLTGRVDDMLIIRGINVFPSQVEHCLMQIPEISGQNYMIIVTRDGSLDSMRVQVELRKEFFSDKIDDLLEIRKKVAYELKNALNVSVDVELTAPDSLPRFEGKAKRVIDRRVL